MIKYLPESVSVVLEEVPDRVTLAVDITNCQGHCEGCHSPYLRGNFGEELTPERIDALIADNFGVNCFLFLGEGGYYESEEYGKTKSYGAGKVTGKQLKRILQDDSQLRVTLT